MDDSFLKQPENRDMEKCHIIQIAGNVVYKVMIRILWVLMPQLQMANVQSKQNYIFISYEWVDHIAVYNYMFRPLSAIVRLYYFLL